MVQAEGSSVSASMLAADEEATGEAARSKEECADEMASTTSLQSEEKREAPNISDSNDAVIGSQGASSSVVPGSPAASGASVASGASSASITDTGTSGSAGATAASPSVRGSRKERRLKRKAEEESGLIEVQVPGYFSRPWDMEHCAERVRARLGGEAAIGADRAAVSDPLAVSRCRLQWDKPLTWALGPDGALCNPLISVSGMRKKNKKPQRILVKVCGKTGKASVMGRVSSVKRFASLGDMQFVPAASDDRAHEADAPVNAESAMKLVATELFGDSNYFVSLSSAGDGEGAGDASHTAIDAQVRMADMACSAFLPSIDHTQSLVKAKPSQIRK